MCRLQVQNVMFLGLMAAMFTMTSVQCSVATPLKQSLNGRKVVLMSMDGFRYDYLSKTDTPNFDALIASGVRVPYVNNIFASLTFPCHYTIVTGLYEESHGILGNRMYDPVFNASFRMGNTETRWWDGAEPIWINAVKSGLKAGTYFWPGSETELQGLHPTHYRPYDARVPFEERVDTVVDDWLARGHVDFATIYFNEPDHSGHKYGPDSPALLPVIRRMDSLLGYFMDKLDKAGIKDKVDLIVTSDHGMTTVNATQRLIAITDHVNDSILQHVVGGGAFAHVTPQPGKARELVSALSDLEHLQVYLKEDIPLEYHHKNHRRVQPVLVVADDGWEVRKTGHGHKMRGNHGYRSSVKNMRPIFVASGPSFKAGGLEFEPIRSVDIYPLLCQLLYLEAAPNNGSLDHVRQFLVEDNNPNTAAYHTTQSSYTLCLTLTVIAFTFVHRVWI